jgi:hypothetical protein
MAKLCSRRSGAAAGIQKTTICYERFGADTERREILMSEDDAGLRRTKFNPYRFKQNLKAGSGVTVISWLGCGEHHRITLNQAKKIHQDYKKAPRLRI